MRAGRPGRFRPRQRGAVGLRRIGGRRARPAAARSACDASSGARAPRAAGRRRRAGELRRAEPGDEVAAPHLAALLEHLEHAVHRGEPADDALGEHRLAGDDAVALEQLQRPRRGPPRWRVGRGSSSGATRLQRPAPAGGPMRSEPRRAPARRARRRGRCGGAAGAPRRSDDRARSGAERVVGDLAGPHQVPQRGRAARRRSGRSTPARSWPQKLAPPPAEHGRGSRRGARRRAGRPAPSPAPAAASWSAKQSRTRPSLEPIAPAPTHTTSPDVHSSSSSAGRYSATRAASTSRLERRRDDRRARRAPRAPRPAASAPRRVAPGCRATPAGTRASAACSTGSTSRRSAASERRRSWRSTSTSHHSRRTPVGPELAAHQPLVGLERAEGAERPGSPAMPNRRATSCVDERAVGAGVATDEILERARHRVGERLRQAERQGAAERVAIAGGVVGGDVARPRRRRRPRWRGARRPARRAAHGRWCRSRPTPRSAGRARRASGRRLAAARRAARRALRARRPSERRCRSSSTSASTPGSSSSRSSSAPSRSREQVTVEGERRGPPLGERGIALVHVGGDPVEQQALRHRRRLRRVDVHHAHGPRLRSWPSTSRSAGTSNTSCRHSRDVSSRIGNVGYLAATASRSAARWRCCHSGVRRSGRRRGSSSARAAHSRNRDENSAVCGSVATTSSSMSSGSIWNASSGHLVGGLGQAQHDAVVAPHRLDRHVVAVGEAALDRHRPRRVHRRAERAEHAHAPVADLVAEALDDDRAVVGHDAGRLGLLVDVLQEVARGELVEGVVVAQAIEGGVLARRCAARARTRRAPGRARAGGPGGRRARTASCPARPAPG